MVSYHKNKVLFEQNFIFWLKKVDFHQSGNETVKMEVLYIKLGPISGHDMYMYALIDLLPDLDEQVLDAL